MAVHNTLGKTGEDAAAAYLVRDGYCIRHRNWREKHLELDIVAEKGGELIVVEVKTRTTARYQMPQDAVNRKKMKRILEAADAYLKHFNLDMPVRFDILTLVGNEGNFRIEHIANAFYPTGF